MHLLEVATPSLDARKLEKICFIHINFAESNFDQQEFHVSVRQRSAAFGILLRLAKRKDREGKKVVGNERGYGRKIISA